MSVDLFYKDGSEYPELFCRTSRGYEFVPLGRGSGWIWRRSQCRHLDNDADAGKEGTSKGQPSPRFMCSSKADQEFLGALSLGALEFQLNFGSLFTKLVAMGDEWKTLL